ncbi:hypothetical protein LguiA_029967 [Lonicera macranthoides]
MHHLQSNCLKKGKLAYNFKLRKNACIQEGQQKHDKSDIKLKKCVYKGEAKQKNKDILNGTNLVFP